MESKMNADGTAQPVESKNVETASPPENQASGSWIEGAIQRFKESQRLPLLSRLMESNRQLASDAPADLDFGNFYHL